MLHLEALMFLVWVYWSTMVIQKSNIQNGWEGKGNHHCEGFRSCRSQHRPRFRRFPFVFAFKETSGRPEGFTNTKRWKRNRHVVACAGGRVLWHRSAKKIRVRLNKCLWQQWWLCCKIARDTCWECLTRCLTLLCYHEKSYVNSTMGSIWPHCKKKPEYKHSLLQCSFPPNNISQHRFVLKYRQIGTTLS